MTTQEELSVQYHMAQAMGMTQVQMAQHFYTADDMTPVVIEGVQDERGYWVLHAGEVPPLDVIQHLGGYMVVFLYGVTVLGNSWRRYMLQYFREHITTDKVIFIVPEPRNENDVNWETVDGGMGGSDKYSQVKWEMFWRDLTLTWVMWHPGYWTALAAGPLFRPVSGDRANIGITARLEAGELLASYKYHGQFHDWRVFAGTPKSAANMWSMQEHYEDVGLEWYRLSRDDEGKGIPVSPKLMKDAIAYINMYMENMRRVTAIHDMLGGCSDTE